MLLSSVIVIDNIIIIAIINVIINIYFFIFLHSLLVGDYTYGADRVLEKKSARMMLHAHHLKYVQYVHLLTTLSYLCIHSN
jgi:hypothetical protein